MNNIQLESEKLRALEDRLRLIHNEQIKLNATYLNGLAIASYAVGVLAPVVAQGMRPTAFTYLISAAFILSGAIVHSMGVLWLRKLR